MANLHVVAVVATRRTLEKPKNAATIPATLAGTTTSEDPLTHSCHQHRETATAQHEAARLLGEEEEEEGAEEEEEAEEEQDSSILSKQTHPQPHCT